MTNLFGEMPVCPDCHAVGYEQGHAGCHAFPVGDETLVGSTDPSTSAEAADSLQSSGRLGVLQRAALSLVTLHPGLTGHELDALWAGRDGVTIARRLSELLRVGRVRTGEPRINPVTGKRCVTWWAE